jgi:dUTPase
MNPIEVIINNTSAQRPTVIFEMAMGLEVYSAETKLIEKGKKEFVNTGITIQIPGGYYGQICGSAANTSNNIVTGQTIIDPKYPTDVRVLLINNTIHDLPIMVGDKIALLCIVPQQSQIMSVDYNLPANLNDANLNQHILSPDSGFRQDSDDI